jgi:hypothetical protein
LSRTTPMARAAIRKLELYRKRAESETERGKTLKNRNGKDLARNIHAKPDFRAADVA